METASCLGFNIACDTLLKGTGVTIAAFILFVASVYMLLAAVMGRWMGYLLLSVAFWGWMIIQSSLWLFGFWSQGPETPVNLGPRGPEPAWVVSAAGSSATVIEDEAFGAYPAGDWTQLDEEALSESDAQAIQGAATSYLAEEANHELGVGEFDPGAVPASAFVIESVATTTSADGTPLAVVQAHYAGGGPATTIAMNFDEGNVAAYGWMFLIASLILFAVHIPLLDRAERSRREFLTGGSATPWYGPA